MILGSEYTHNPWVYYPVAFGFLILSYLLVVLIPDAVIFFKIVGGIFVVFTACILPNMVYFKVSSSKTKPILLCIITGVCVALGWASAIKAIVEGK